MMLRRKRTRSREMSATYSIMLWAMSLRYDGKVSGVRWRIQKARLSAIRIASMSKLRVPMIAAFFSGWAFRYAFVPTISGTQMKLMVRFGRGSFPSLMSLM